MIKCGSIKYFTLLRFQEVLDSPDFNRLDLTTLEKLKAELEIKIKAIELEAKEKKNA